MDKPTAAYKGAEAYVFACYAHVDSGMVFDDLVQLNNQGVNIWYDEGIQAGSSWRAEIASAITGASKFLFFISEASLASAHCLREVDYALSNNIPIIPIYLDESKLPPELDLALNRVQALFRNDDSRYQDHLLEALRKGPGLTSVTVHKKRNPMSLVAVFAVIAIAVLLVFNWQIDKSEISDGIQSAETVATPSAFEPYLEGMELMERWDKDDNLETAISKYQEAIEADPEFALAYARLAEALRMQYALTRDKAKLQEAMSNINRALSMNPDLAPIQTVLGRIQITQGNMGLAQNALEQAVSIDPNDPTANSALARLYERLGRMEDAEASFQKSVSLDPEDLRIIDSYANFL
ncbi:MAG TPA: TIR domain-containing protein, partial [Xanthomonadales bacterium]|nr:TIR domain-containing protein [Xanthomonadales bacterium]